jgi:hypothetical protein
MPDPFTTEEDSILKEFYGKIPIRRNARKESLQDKLWGRSESQIINRIKELELKVPKLEYLHHYNQEDIEYLKKNYATTSWEELTFMLGRDRDSITSKACKLGLKRAERESTWSSDDIKYLVENYPTMTAREIGEKLGKSRFSVYHRAGKMGLKKR